GWLVLRPVISRDPDIGLKLLRRRYYWPEVAMWEVWHPTRSLPVSAGVSGMARVSTCEGGGFAGDWWCVRFKRHSDSPLKKKARRGFRGYPVATIAFYGPDDKRASKVAVGVVTAQDAEPIALERWFAEEGDVRTDPVVGSDILRFVRDNGAVSVVMSHRLHSR